MNKIPKQVRVTVDEYGSVVVLVRVDPPRQHGREESILNKYFLHNLFLILIDK